MVSGFPLHGMVIQSTQDFQGQWVWMRVGFPLQGGITKEGSCPDRHQISTKWRMDEDNVDGFEEWSVHMRMDFPPRLKSSLSHGCLIQCLFVLQDCYEERKYDDQGLRWRRMHAMSIRKINASKIEWGFLDRDSRRRRWGLDQSWRRLHFDGEQMKESKFKKWTQRILHQEI